MTRTQIQLDDQTKELLRRRAFREKRSVSAVARDLLRQALSPAPKRRKRPRYDFSSIIGIFHDAADVSERHDDYLNEGDRW